MDTNLGDRRNHHEAQCCRSGQRYLQLLVKLLELGKKHAALFKVGDVILEALFGGRNVAKDDAHRFAVVGGHESQDLVGHFCVHVRVWSRWLGAVSC